MILCDASDGEGVVRRARTPDAGVRTVVNGVWKVAAPVAVPLRLAELTKG